MTPEETAAAILAHLPHCPPGCHSDNTDPAPDTEPDWLTDTENDWRAGHHHPGRKP